MRLALTAATAGLVILALSGCEQPPPSSAGTPQFEPLELDLPDVEAGAAPEEYGPLLPAEPDGPEEAPDPQMPDEVTAYCHGGAVIDYKPKTADARERAQGICTDQDTYDRYGFTESDPSSSDASQFQQDMQRWLDQQ